MAFVYFADADGVVHEVPSELTHFQPNAQTDPYVVPKLSITYVSGAVIEYRITADYFATMLGFVDETSPTYNNLFFVKDLQMGAFVRYLGSKKAVPAIMNYVLANGNMDSLVMRALLMTEDVDPELVIEYDDHCRSLTMHDGGAEEKEYTTHTTRDSYAHAVMRIVDECEHVREVIDYIATSTNACYARKLDGHLDRIIGILDQLNPMHHLFAVQWLGSDLRKIPEHVIDDWVADMNTGF
jgi:hypothetical protein